MTTKYMIQVEIDHDRPSAVNVQDILNMIYVRRGVRSVVKMRFVADKDGGMFVPDEGTRLEVQ